MDMEHEYEPPIECLKCLDEENDVCYCLEECGYDRHLDSEFFCEDDEEEVE